MDLCRVVIADTTMTKEDKSKFVANGAGLVGALASSQTGAP